MTPDGHSAASPAPAPAGSAGPPDTDIEELSRTGAALHLRLFAHRRRPPMGLIVGPVVTVTAAASIGLVANLGASARVLVAIAVCGVLIVITAIRAYIQLARDRDLWIEGGCLRWRLMGRRRHALPLSQVREIRDENAGLPRDRGRIDDGSGPRPFQGGTHHLTASLAGGKSRRLFDLLDMAPATRAWLVERVNRAVERGPRAGTARGGPRLLLTAPPPD